MGIDLGKNNSRLVKGMKLSIVSMQYRFELQRTDVRASARQTRMYIGLLSLCVVGDKAELRLRATGARTLTFIFSWLCFHQVRVNLPIAQERKEENSKASGLGAHVAA